MGLENRIVYDLVDVVEGRCRLRQALIKDKHFPDLCLLPAAQTRDKDAVRPDEMIALCHELRRRVRLRDRRLPGRHRAGFRNAIAGADEVLIVTTPEVSAVRDADRIIGLVEAFEKGHPRLILNRLKPRMVSRGEMMSDRRCAGDPGDRPDRRGAGRRDDRDGHQPRRAGGPLDTSKAGQGLSRDRPAPDG